VLNGKDAPGSGQRSGLVVAGGAIGALLAASCCILPLVLIMLGIGGAWVGTLSSLKAYQPLFALVTIAFLAVAYWRIYRSSDSNCDDESCAPPESRRVLKVVFWTSAGLVLAALTADIWAPYFY
jgi:mercuric ion transport protein